MGSIVNSKVEALWKYEEVDTIWAQPGRCGEVENMVTEHSYGTWNLCPKKRNITVRAWHIRLTVRKGVPL